MKIGKAKSTWLSDGDLRFDSSFHLSEGRVYKNLINNAPLGSYLLKDATSALFNGARFKRYYVQSDDLGVPFMGSSDMLKLDLDGLKLISKKLSKNIKALRISKEWTLVSCSGTIGNTVFANSDFDNKTASQHILRVVPNGKIPSGYLYAFLTSKYGYALLTQGTYGAVIQHIEPHHIEYLPVPTLEQNNTKEIDQLIKQSGILRVEANKALKTATKIFETKIGESKVHLGYQTGKIKATSINSFHKRLDSQFQLLWKDLDSERVNSIEYEKVYEFAKSIFVGGRGKRNYVENGVAFLSSSDMMLFNPKRGCKCVSKNNPGLDSMMVSKKDILISRSGTVGNTVLVGEDLAGTAISEHALRLVIDPDKISPNYVFCFLKTKYGMKSMEASSFGSVIITLNEDLIGNINLPILEKESQEKINDLIEIYITKMDEATKKENQAIDLVEKEIESWQK
ncbi:restriction endonuclease subunit S [Flavobacteriales bacterium]|nr:restriction endonuclease subunit S [Flavobacteriales bacterium]